LKNNRFRATTLTMCRRSTAGGSYLWGAAANSG